MIIQFPCKRDRDLRSMHEERKKNKALLSTAQKIKICIDKQKLN